MYQKKMDLLLKKIENHKSKWSYDLDIHMIHSAAEVYLKEKSLDQDEMDIGIEDVYQQIVDFIWKMEGTGKEFTLDDFFNRKYQKHLTLLGEPFAIDYESLDAAVSRCKHWKTDANEATDKVVSVEIPQNSSKRHDDEL